VPKPKPQNKPPPPAQRNDLGQLMKGSTANPGGRPKLDAEARALIVEMAGPLTVKAIQTLERNMDSVDGFVSNAAARTWLSKTLPDAAIAIELSGKDGGPIRHRIDFTKLPVEKRKELLALVVAARALPAGE